MRYWTDSVFVWTCIFLQQRTCLVFACQYFLGSHCTQESLANAKVSARQLWLIGQLSKSSPKCSVHNHTNNNKHLFMSSYSYYQNRLQSWKLTVTWLTVMVDELCTMFRWRLSECVVCFASKFKSGCRTPFSVCVSNLVQICAKVEDFVVWCQDRWFISTSEWSRQTCMSSTGLAKYWQVAY